MTDTPASAGLVVESPRPVRARSRPRRWRRWGVAAGLVALAAVTVAMTRPLDYVKSLFGRSAVEAGFHAVKPVTLNVVLQEDGELKAVHSVELKCEVQAQNVKIEWIIDESTKVNKGDLLVRLASDDIKDRVEQEEMELRKIEAGLAEARESLDITRSENASKLRKVEIDLEVAELEQTRYTDGETPKSEMAAEIAILQTRMELVRKTVELDKSKRLFERGFVTQAKLDELDDDVARLKMTLNKNELELRILNDYEVVKNKKQKAAAVDQAREEFDREKQRSASRENQAEAKVKDQDELFDMRKRRLERLKEQLAKCEITAPSDGIVQYGESGGGRWWGGNRVAAGEQVYPGQTLITIPDTSQMMVTTRIHEADRHKITEDLPCIIKVPAVPGHTFTGKLTKIAKFADSERSWLNPNLKEHAAEIVFDESEAPLSPGDTAHVEILIEDVPDVLAVPVQCVYSRGAQHFVFLRGAVSTKPAEVKLGRSSTTMIEIESGLALGDKVVMAPDEQMLSLLPAPAAPAGKPAPGGPPAPGGAGRGRKAG